MIKEFIDKRNRGKQLIFIFFLLIIFLTASQVLLSRIRSQVLLNEYRKSRDFERSRTENNYSSLLNKIPAEEIISEETPPPIAAKVAHGRFNLYFIFVKPPPVLSSSVTPLISQLKSGAYFSLNTIAGYLREQAFRYRVSDLDLTVTTVGPFNMESLVKAGDSANPWGKDPFAVANLEDQFDALLTKAAVKSDPEGIYIFFYFDNEFSQTAGEASERFYDFKKFRSFANEEKNRIYINVYNFDKSFAPTLILISVHEILHLFGATDKYLEASESGGCSPKGRGETLKKPVFPQTTGDIMCLYIERKTGEFYRGSLIDGNIVVNEITAGEIGWREELD